MFQSMLGALSADLAIDMGTYQTRIFVRGRGVVCRQASVIAIYDAPSGRSSVIHVGDEARAMLGRTPPDVRVVQPVRDGVVVDFDGAETLLRHLMLQVQGRRLWVGPRAAVCVPHKTPDVERRALRESAEASGARQVILVEQPLAAALGAELPVSDARGHMVVDIGGGTTTVAVLSLGGVVHHHRLKVGGAHLDQAIAHYIADAHGLLIGAQTAQEIKLSLASALPVSPGQDLEVRGRHIDTGWPRAAIVGADEIHSALAVPLRLIMEAVLSGLELTPPDLASDIAETGIVLTGGGALLSQLDRAMSEATGLAVVVPEDPSCTAVAGAARMVDAPAVDVAAAG